LASKPVIVITGTSGAGKGTLERPLMQRIPELELAISATTRERRGNEQHGVQYWFVSEQRFQELLDDDAFIEHVDHPWGQRVGTLRSELDRIWAKSKVPMLDLETKGALAIQREVPSAVTIFVKAPSFAELERRLRERASESAGEIEKRLEVAREQLTLEDEFDHVIVNDDLDRAVDELEGVVREALAAAGSMAS
jgi:guanylate kinase